MDRSLTRKDEANYAIIPEKMVLDTSEHNDLESKMHLEHYVLELPLWLCSIIPTYKHKAYRYPFIWKCTMPYDQNEESL